MINPGLKRKLLVALLIGTMSWVISGPWNTSNIVYAKKIKDQKIEEQSKNNIDSQEQLVDLIKSLKDTIDTLDTRLSNIETKIDLIEEQDKREKSDELIGKWSNFSKPETESKAQPAIVNAEKEPIPQKPSKKGELEIIKPLDKDDKVVTKEVVTTYKEKPKTKEAKVATTITSSPESKKADLKPQKPTKEKAAKEKQHYKFNISTEKTTENGYETGLIKIGGLTVIAYRSEIAGYTAFQRANIVAQKIESLLIEGKDFKNLRPGLSNGLFVGSLDGDAIFTVDATTAERSGLDGDNLTLAWVNNIRKAFGLPGIKRNISISSSRSLSAAGRPEGNIFERESQMQETSRIINMLLPITPVKAAISLMGQASWYGPYFHGRRSADGSRFNMHEMTAAHKSLPFGTLVRVTNTRNNRSCIVRITDRGPFIHGRIIDLSKAAAQEIGMLGSGVANVKIEVIGKKH
jgi:hypothetical protein